MAMLIQSTIAMSVRSKQHNKRKINKQMDTKTQNSPMEDNGRLFVSHVKTSNPVHLTEIKIMNEF